MKLPYYQLDAHLSKKLAPLYLLNGDDLLLVQEAADLIRASARAAGYTERLSLTIDTGTDWGKLLYTEAHSLSLFANKRIVECHLASAKPNAATSQILQDIANNPLADTLLLITTHKLDSKTEQTSWYKALDKTGVVIPIWPMTMEQLPTWMIQRAKKIGLTIFPDAAKHLAELVEGNSLAAAQEIEKLNLLHPGGTINLETIEKSITDNARFDIFGLVDCALSGNSKKSLRMLSSLEAESIEPILILWALTRECRNLAEMARQVKQGASLQSLFPKFRIWEKRQPAVRRFLQHHHQQSCWEMLIDAAKVDSLVKGATHGNSWEALQQLVLKISGNAIMTHEETTELTT